MCSPYELDLEKHIDKSTCSAIVAWAKIAIGVNPMFRIISARMTRRLQFETPNIWSTWTHLNEPTLQKIKFPICKKYKGICKK